MSKRTLFWLAIKNITMFMTFLFALPSHAKDTYVLKLDALTIPHPMEGYEEIFVENSGNAKFKQINFDGSLRLYFVLDSQAASFLHDNEFFPDLGLKVNVKHIQSNKEEFSKFVKDLESAFFGTIPKNTVVEDTCLGGKCSVKNMFPIKVFTTKYSATCLWLLEYSASNKDEKRNETKNYYYATHLIYIHDKMITLSAFIDLANEISTEALEASLISWGLSISKAN